MKRTTVRALAAALTLSTLISVGVEAQSRRHNKEKKDDEVPITILDASETQWGMRSVNASVYQGLPMNAVMLERGRQPLPASFPRYQPKPLGTDIVIRSKDAAPATIRVNGVETPMPEGDKP